MKGKNMRRKTANNIGEYHKNPKHWVVAGIGFAALGFCSLIASIYLYHISLLLIAIGIIFTVISSAFAASHFAFCAKSRFKLDVIITMFIFIIILTNIGFLVPSAVSEYGLNRIVNEAKEREKVKVGLVKSDIEEQLSEIQYLRASLDSLDIESPEYQQTFNKIDDKVAELANNIPWLDSYSNRLGEDRQHVINIGEIDSILWLAKIYVDI